MFKLGAYRFMLIWARNMLAESVTFLRSALSSLALEDLESDLAWSALPAAVLSKVDVDFTDAA